jgi:hypothetical protein
VLLSFCICTSCMYTSSSADSGGSEPAGASITQQQQQQQCVQDSTDRRVHNAQQHTQYPCSEAGSEPAGIAQNSSRRNCAAADTRTVQICSCRVFLQTGSRGGSMRGISFEALHRSRKKQEHHSPCRLCVQLLDCSISSARCTPPYNAI